VTYPDTSFLIALYVADTTSEQARRYMHSASHALVFTPFHRLEFRTALRTRVFRGGFSREQMRETFRHCDEHLDGDILQHTPLNWADTLREAERIAEAHLTEVGARSGDLLHVASAVVLGTRDFITFDDRQNALAKRAGLRVRRWRAS